jgi:hypothetical protein
MTKDLGPKGLLIKPFQFANVYPAGNVCWGTNNKPPTSLFGAWNQYWSAPFNKDLVSKFENSLQYTLQNFNPDEIYQTISNSKEWLNNSQALLGKTFLITDTKPQAVFVFKKPRVTTPVVEGTKKKAEILPDNLPSSYKFLFPAEEVVVGWGRYNQVDDHWYITVEPTDKTIPAADRKARAILMKKKGLSVTVGKVTLLGFVKDLVFQ